MAEGIGENGDGDWGKHVKKGWKRKTLVDHIIDFWTYRVFGFVFFFVAANACARKWKIKS